MLRLSELSVVGRMPDRNLVAGFSPFYICHRPVRPLTGACTPIALTVCLGQSVGKGRVAQPPSPVILRQTEVFGAAPGVEAKLAGC